LFFAAAIERASAANVPISVPAESTVNLVAGSFDAKIPSAKGDLQIFPKQTIKIFTDIMCLERFFMNIFDNFFELLIGSN
jgi:hypothetical protein